MIPAPQHNVKGWCPGALRPMESGDGLIVRVRPPCGAFSLDCVRVLSEASRVYGNGHLDLTRRANLQIRGVSEAARAGLMRVLDDAGLLDDSVETEAVRNIMINPLAGLDTAESNDMRHMARELAVKLINGCELRGLTAKFGFVLDGGGLLPLTEERADVRLMAIRGQNSIAIAIGLDLAGTTLWLGSATLDRATDEALNAARAVLARSLLRSRSRVRHLNKSELTELTSSLSSRLQPLHAMPAQRALPKRNRIGVFDFEGRGAAVGIGAPFGRIEADQLERLCALLAVAGANEIRLSPWRVLYAPVSHANAAAKVLDGARTLGLISEPGDPILKIEACPGAPACRSAAGDTRMIARRLAGVCPDVRLHVSGCAKGCACSAPTDLVLVAEAEGYTVIVNGTAAGEASQHVSVAELVADPAFLVGLLGRRRHA